MPTNIPKTNARFETTPVANITSGATSFSLATATDIYGKALSGLYGFSIDEGQSAQEFFVGTVSGTTISSIQAINDSSDPLNNFLTGLQQPHRKSAVVKITDYPLLAYLREILNGNVSYPIDNPLSYTTHPSFTSRTQIIDKGYADDTIAGLVGTATTTTFGTVKTTTSNTTVMSTDDTRLTSNSGTTINGSSNKIEDSSDTAATSAANKLVRTTGSGVIDPSFINQTAYGNPFGDGADGSVTFDGSTTVLGLVPSSSVYTLTRDIYLTTGTVNNGVTIESAGYRIFASTSLTNNGTIKRTPNPGGAASGIVGGTAGAALASGSMYGGVAGQVGGVGHANGDAGTNGAAGTAGTAQTDSIGVVGVAGGNGGNSSGHTGGTNGGAGALTAANPAVQHNFFSILPMAYFNLTSYLLLKGPSGSSSGGGGAHESAAGASGAGGGSGSSGGIVFIAAKTLTNSGTISANGGAGGNGSAAATGGGTDNGGGGGGAGGSGGIVVLIYHTVTLGTVTVTGGTGGTAGAGSSNGADTAGGTGATGTTGSIYQFAL